MNKTGMEVLVVLIIIFATSLVFYITNYKRLPELNKPEYTSSSTTTAQPLSSTTKTTQFAPDASAPQSFGTVTFRAYVIGHTNSVGQVLMEVSEVIRGRANKNVKVNVKDCNISSSAGDRYLIVATTSSISDEFSCITARYEPGPSF